MLAETRCSPEPIDAGKGETRRGEALRAYFWPTIIDKRPTRGSPGCYCPLAAVLSPCIRADDTFRVSEGQWPTKGRAALRIREYVRWIYEPSDLLASETLASRSELAEVCLRFPFTLLLSFRFGVMNAGRASRDEEREREREREILIEFSILSCSEGGNRGARRGTVSAQK